MNRPYCCARILCVCVFTFSDVPDGPPSTTRPNRVQDGVLDCQRVSAESQFSDLPDLISNRSVCCIVSIISLGHYSRNDEVDPKRLRCVTVRARHPSTEAFPWLGHSAATRLRPDSKDLSYESFFHAEMKDASDIAFVSSSITRFIARQYTQPR